MPGYIWDIKTILSACRKPFSSQNGIFRKSITKTNMNNKHTTEVNILVYLYLLMQMYIRICAAYITTKNAMDIRFPPKTWGNNSFFQQCSYLLTFFVIIRSEMNRAQVTGVNIVAKHTTPWNTRFYPCVPHLIVFGKTTNNIMLYKIIWT